MDTKQFVACWKQEKATFLDDSYLTDRLREAGLLPEQLEQFKHAVDGILTDVMYTLLLGLDGAASIGDDQQHYLISTENGEVISNGNGELEVEAYEAFHSQHILST